MHTAAYNVGGRDRHGRRHKKCWQGTLLVLVKTREKVTPVIYKIGERLVPIENETWEKERPAAVFLTDSAHAEETLKKQGLYMIMKSSLLRLVSVK